MAKLLFINTFAHDTAEELNIDYVKFSSGALATLREIRIIPGGARIPIAEAPQRQGITAPNSFSLEVFAKNFKRSNSSVFERIAVFDYNFDSDIRFQVPAYTTDGVLFKGKYTALTVAIYGDPVSGDSEASHALLSKSSMAPVAISPTSSSTPTAFLPSPVDAAGGLLAVNPNVMFATQQPAQMVPVAAAIPTWVAPPPPVIHMTPPLTYNPMVPPPPTVAVIPSYQPAPNTAGSANVYVSTTPAYASGGMVPPPVFDPTRPPPTFHTPQHSPQLVSPQSKQQRRNSPTESRRSRASRSPRRRHEPSRKTKSKYDDERRKDQPAERKSSESKARSKPATPSVTTLSKQKEKTTTTVSAETVQADDSEYTHSEGEISEKFDLENISEDEFEFDDSMAAEVNDTELQEDLLSDVRFNVSQFVPVQLKYFKDPSLSVCESGLATEDSPILASELLAKLEACESGVYNENWIIGIERICNLVDTVHLYIIRHMNQPDIIERLISCVLNGLDKEKASQQETILIVRHQKAAIRLATALFQSERTVAIKLCEAKIQHRLLDLLESDTMPTPVQLLIIKALDASIFFDIGIQTMLFRSSDDSNVLTPYERLTQFICNEKSARVMFSIHCLMQKIVLYHSLRNVFATANKIANATKTESTNDDDDQQSDKSNDDSILNEADILALCENLARIIELYRNADSVLVQPSLSLPTTSAFAKSQRTADPYSGIYKMFNSNHLLPSLYLLMTHWSTGSESRIVTLILQLLTTLSVKHTGLIYFASNNELVQEILQFLTQKDDPLEDDNTSMMQDFGLDLAYYLQALQHVDALMSMRNDWRGDVDNPDALKRLQAFYVLTLDETNERRGTRAVVRVLSWKNNLASILPFIELTGDTELDNKIRKSACTGYAAELLLLVLRYSDSVNYLRTFQDKLLTVSSQEVTSKLAEVKQWTEPLRKLPGFTIDSVEYLCEKLKFCVNTEGVTPSIPKGLITVLRLLQLIAVEPTKLDDIEKQGELRYKYALVQLHYFDGFSTIIQLIDKLAESYLVFWQQGIGLNNKHGHIFYACIVPAVTLVRAALSYLIHCRGGEYSDLTPIVPLLKLYTVSCTLASAFGIMSETQRVQKEIISALLAFTQPEVAIPRAHAKKTGSTDGLELTKSLWTKLIVEIIKFAMTAPCHYISGLSVFSELLPLPLPIPTKEPCTPEEISIVQFQRRLWSLQLAPIADQIQTMVQDFAQSTQHTLQQGLRRVCLQLADLSASMANVVVTAVLDTALEHCEVVEKRTNSKEPDEPAVIVRREVILPATASFGRVLNLLSYMTSQASFKTALLGLIKPKTESKADGYGRILQYMLSILCHPSTERHHRICQEYIVSTLQSLSDEQIGMVLSESAGLVNEQIMALPDIHQLRDICCALLKHIGDSAQAYATILPSLRVFVMLCEHDHGLDCIKRAFESDDHSLLALLERFVNEFSGHSADCISTLSTLLLFLRSLQIIEEHAPLRKRKISVSLVRKLLNWKKDSANKNHCLVKLKNLLADAMEEETSVYSLYDDVVSMMKMLSATDEDEDEKDNDEQIQVPIAMDIQYHFNYRQVWMICTDANEDRLQTNYWFPAEILDEDDDRAAERISYDLINLKGQYVPDFDLAKALETKILAKRVEESDVTKRKVMPSGIINTSRGERKRFIAPLRGRGNVPRGSMTTRVNDPFRNRMPNTSRPPSMHVDDFILAQRHGDTGDMSRSTQAGQAPPRDGTRGGGNRGNNRGNYGRYDGYPGTTDVNNRTFSKPGNNAPSGPSSGYRPRGSMFDRPHERHGRGSGSSRHGGKSSRSSSKHKSPSRYRASSK